jgi:hypothetical protein
VGDDVQDQAGPAGRAFPVEKTPSIRLMHFQVKWIRFTVENASYI